MQIREIAPASYVRQTAQVLYLATWTALEPRKTRNENEGKKQKHELHRRLEAWALEVHCGRPQLNDSREGGRTTIGETNNFWWDLCKYAQRYRSPATALRIARRWKLWWELARKPAQLSCWLNSEGCYQSHVEKKLFVQRYANEHNKPSW